MQEGQRPAALLCDAACVQAGRQQQLAGAFGVEDPSHHVSSFDRNRSAHLHACPVNCRYMHLDPMQNVRMGFLPLTLVCILQHQPRVFVKETIALCTTRLARQPNPMQALLFITVSMDPTVLSIPSL